MMEEEFSLLFRRAEDMIRRSERGEVARSPFLSPREAHALKVYLARRGVKNGSFFWGGYRGAERTRLFLLPGYLQAFLDADEELDLSFGTRGGTKPSIKSEDGYPVDLIDSYTDGAVSDAVTAIEICGSGYRDLSHRDYLGSILGLGIERDVLGDIVTDGAFRAVAFCDGKIAAFLRETLSRVGTDKVKITAFTPPDDFSGNRHVLPLSGTVASERLDSVVAALTGESREAAQKLITSGLCEVDFETVEKPDRVLTPPCQISVRGFGRYLLHEFDGETKKGRLRLRADKYV